MATEPAPHPQNGHSPHKSNGSNDAVKTFGPNEWLVDELYAKFLEDRESVDPAWWEFFADYKPGQRDSQDPTAAAPAPAAPATTSTPAVSATPTAPTAADKKAAPKQASPQPATDSEVNVLRGPAARVVTNMEASLAVPTATSVRAVPAKLLVDNRVVINNHLARTRGGKVSFTHIISYAIVQALKTNPEMNASFVEVDGKPGVETPSHVNFGLAIDLAKEDGSRQLLVPNIKAAETLDFNQFFGTYDDLIRRARDGRLGVDDFAGTTISLTNPGTIGTVHSVPRLMPGQGAIIGAGAMNYPAEWQGASKEVLAKQGVGKILTLTSTYDHRIIQGAQSGDFLRRIEELLLGADDFYDSIFHALRIPYVPVRWSRDINLSHDDQLSKTARVQSLIHAYRVRGHLIADTDPLNYKRKSHPDLEIENHGLTLWDLDREFATGAFSNESFMLLRDILGVLRDSYCRTIGIEYMHIQDPVQRKWIQDRVEVPYQRPPQEEQMSILRRLNSAEAFENFLQTKYVGQKRFSLEGAESAIPILTEVLAGAADAGLKEVCIGMPHRGRLNVLANIAGKSYAQIFREFEGSNEDSVQGSGDVKYHLGQEGTFTSLSGAQIPVYLAANPSHLEAVNSVLEGITRAKQDQLDRGEEFPVLPLLMHGDAAFAGQGIVAETLNLSQLRGYRTGGTIHLVVNNQVGFTTSPEASRSSEYATDVARMVQAPIFHVNGDDPEACIHVANLAFQFREAFHKDVVIDMICYRRRGHNEADDPSLTQPLMYDIIENKRSVRKLYTEQLIGRGDISIEEAEAALQDYQGQLERAFAETRDGENGHDEVVPLPPPAFPAEVSTSITTETVERIVDSQINLPEDLRVHKRLKPQLERRESMIKDGTIDWAMAETMAFGSLLLEGRSVRLTGQDSRRGTFGQRHAAIIDPDTGAEWLPLKHLSNSQGKFYVYDSLLSEYAVLGFEYGYSVYATEDLVLWEAQFGDFANGAQTIIDEFISASEQKWMQNSGVVMLLPHGYEGQGPDHSSARPERYLQLAAQENMSIWMPSTPASYFHALRWQALSQHHKPMIVFTPKSMLRLKTAASPIESFTENQVRPVIDDRRVKDRSKVRRILLCSGKITWDLIAKREAGVEAGEFEHDEVAIIRLERLYPLPESELKSILSEYPTDAELVWVQEEPENQGAWSYLLLNLYPKLKTDLRAITRAPSASTATGSHMFHEMEQTQVVDAAFSDL